MATNWWETGSTLVEEEPTPTAPVAVQEDNWWEAQSTPVREPNPVKDYESSSKLASVYAQQKDSNYSRYQELAQLPERTPDVVAEMVKSFNAGKEAEIGLYREQEILGKLQSQIAEQEKNRKIEEARKAREQAASQAAEASKIAALEATKPSDSVLRQAADLPVQFAIGINSSVKGLTDLFGADNAVSQNLNRNVDWYRGLLSASSKQDEQEIDRILKEAEGKGILDQLGAGLEAFSVAPADFVASGLGSLATFAATGVAGRAAAAARAAKLGLAGTEAATAIAKGVQATQLATGVAMGAGAVKGQIYQSVKDEMLSQGKTEDEARKVAMEAQSYMGKNLPSIIAGAGLGALDSFTGAEKVLSKILVKGGIKPDASRIVNIIKNGITEAVPEFLQGAQEQLSSNIALRNEGVDVPITKGVFSQGAMEGLVGLGMGLGAGAFEPRIQTPPTKEEVSAAASETQDVARQSKDVAPATASLVEGEAEQIVKGQAETPDQRVARLKQEAKAATGIDLGEEVPVSGAQPVSPTPEITQQAQSRITEREGKEATPTTTPAGTRIEAAAYQAPDGTVYFGASHLDAMAKARDAGKIDQAAIDAKQDVASRETPEFGFSTNAEPFIGRSQAEVIATGSGQMLVNKPATGLLHSNEVSLDAFQEAKKPAEVARPTIKEEAKPITTEAQPATTAQPPITITAPVSQQAQPTPTARPAIDVATLSPNSKRANKILTNAGVDPETAAFVAQQYQDDIADLGGEELRSFILDKFEENGGVIPAQMRYSEDQEYYELAFGINPAEAATLVENAKGQNAQMAQAELEQNKQWRRKDEQVTETKQGVTVAQPEAKAVSVPAGEVPPSPAIEGRRVPLAAPEAAVTTTPAEPAAEPPTKKQGLPKYERADEKYIQGIRPSISDRLDYDPRYSDIITEAAGRKLSKEQEIDVIIEWMQRGREQGEPTLWSDFGGLSMDQAYMVKPSLVSLGLIEPTKAPISPMEAIRKIARGEKTEEGIAGLVASGFVEIYKGQPVLTQSGINALPKDERPTLTPEARKIQIDTRTGAAPAPSPEIRESRRAIITPQQDREYLDAVERGDLDAASRLVEDAAKAAGYNVLPLFHGTEADTIKKFRKKLSGIWLAFKKEDASPSSGERPTTVINAYADLGSNPITLTEDQTKEWQRSGSPLKWMRDFRLENRATAVIIGDYATVVFQPSQVKSADPVTRDDQGNIIPLSQRFQPTEADIRYAKKKVTMGQVGMEPAAVEARIKELGFGVEGVIRVVNQPDASFEGRTIIQDGKVVGIEINAAALKDNAAIDRVLNHEFAESANADGALNKLVENLTTKERKEINDTITRLGYEERARNAEEAARAVEALADAWRGRGFFTRAVARVEAWASKLGYKLTRRAAEYIAARNLSDINEGFKRVYNRFIDVNGEAREARIGEQAVVDADMGRRSQTELTPQEIDQLEKGEKIRVYRAMQVIDGKLYPPMSALVGGKLRKPTEIGTWEKAEERPDLLDKKGKFVLQKGNKATVPAAYNPYFHTSSSPLNDQFSSAYKRDNLVTVEVEIPASELTSGYKAKGAKDAVGEVRWNAGPVSSKLPADKKRRVFLSRYAKVVRIVPDSEVAGIISNLLEGTNLSIPENTVTPSLKSELEKNGVSVTPRPVRGQEIRESRREPEAIPTFTEGSPEAATLKEMADSMAKVDGASEAKGGKPETYKISEIASVWMDSGLGERELQDAIVEYTNLTPANAAKVAKAIAKQYGIQQQLAQAITETPEGISVEGIPEGATISVETDPKRPKTTLQRVIDAITGVRVPTVKITGNEKTLLKEQIKLKAAATRAAKKAQQEMAADVVEAIKAMDIRGGILPKQASALMKRAALINFTSEKSVDRFINYAEKVITNANYDKDLADAKLAQKRAKELAKSKRVPSNQQDVLNGIANIEVGFLEDPREFAEASNHYMRAFKSVVSKDYVVVPDNEMTSYLSEKEDEAGAARSDFDLESITALANKWGVKISDVNNIINAQDTEAALAQYANREVFEGLLSEKAKQSLNALRKYDVAGMTQSQQSMVARAVDLDVGALDQQDKVDLVRRIDNILVNGRTNGFQKYVDIAEAQSNSRKAAMDNTFTGQMAAWINILTGKAIGKDITLVGEKQQKELALTMQSVADTFRNIFGKKQLGKAQQIIGHFDLIKATNAANNAVDSAGKQMEEFYGKQYKKYGKVLSSPETIMAEGIAGYLIQSVPYKSEGDSIAQRRRLIQEDIRVRRATGDGDMIESADMIEEQLAKIDGDSVKAVLNNLKSSHPAAYESLIWLKDTLLPQYKEFLRAHDENYNDQTNNYENTNYLPIKYKFVNLVDLSPDAAKSYAKLDSLTPKQAANTIKRVDYSVLPRGANIDYGIRKNTFNSLAEQLRKAHTASAWTKIDAFLKSSDAAKVFGGGVNVKFMSDRLKLLKDSQERRSYEWRGDAKFFDSLATVSRKFGIGYALGGVYQVFKQVPDQLMTTIANTGRYDLQAENLGTMMFQPKTSGAMKMLSKFPVGRRGDAAMGGSKFVNAMESNYTNLERYFSGGQWAAFKERAQKVNDIWLAALKKSDYVAAASGWMTYYQSYLAQNGVKFTDWNQESDLVDTDKVRQEAAAYAESMIDIYQGSSDPTNMATFAQRGKGGYENIFKAIFMPLNSFALQQRSRMISDARDALTKSSDPEKRSAGVRGLASTIGGMTLFHLTRRYFLPAVSGLGAATIYALLGIDPEEPDEEKKKEMADFRWRQFMSELSSNMFVGGFGSLPEQGFIDALNRAAYFGAEQVDSPDLYNDKGEKIAYSTWLKERSPFWRYREYGTGMNMGMLDITSNQIGQVAEVTRKLNDPELMDTLTNEEKRLIYFAALSEWLYTLRLNDTDMNRMMRNMAKETEAVAKDREKRIQSIRSGR